MVGKQFITPIYPPGKGKSSSKVPAGRGYVSSLEGTSFICELQPSFWRISYCLCGFLRRLLKSLRIFVGEKNRLSCSHWDSSDESKWDTKKMCATKKTLLSKVVSTHRTGTHPFRNLYQQAISRDSFHSWRCRGIAERVCSGGVL